MFSQQQKELYLICSTPKHGYEHNSLLFWGKNNCGHYADINKCQLYTYEQAMEHCYEGSQCVPVKLKDALKYATVHIDNAYDLIKEKVC